MTTILTIRESDAHPGAVDIDNSDFDERRAARAVVLDDQGRVALLKVGNGGYYKLPGGGIDEGETIEQALERELLEEIGCMAKVTDDLGEIVEYRDEHHLKQISYCYIAKQYGKIKQPEFTQSEIDDGFEVLWVHDINEAIKTVQSSNPSEYQGSFIVIRDIKILNLAKSKLGV